MEIKPGTAEYQKLYDEEMRKLEATDSKKEEVTTSEAKEEVDPIAELQKRVEKAEKATEDTKKWGHQQAQIVARLKREADERKKAEQDEKLKPFFDANPDLKQAIEVTAGVQRQTPEEILVENVSRAVPDIHVLLNDPEFAAKAAKRKDELGEAWTDQFTVIRELNELRTEHKTLKMVEEIKSQVRKDFEERSSKLGAMEVPGNTGRRNTVETKSQEDEVKRYQNMTRADLDKERKKVLGYL